MTDTSDTLPHLFLVRPAPEMLLKASGTRRRFEEALRRNLKAMLGRVGARCALDMDEGRILLSSDKHAEARDALSRTFGVASISPIDRTVTGDAAAFERAAVALYAGRLAGKTYAVRVKCIGPRKFRSLDLERSIGAVLNPYGKVDLSNPDVTVRLDLRGETAMFHADRIEGPCGFPIGLQGKVAVLLSGGFDSTVAAWYLMKRGAAAEFVFCNLAGGAYERQVVEIAKTLCDRWGGGMPGRLHVVDFQPVIADLRTRCDPEYWQVVLKRLMYRAGCALAHRTRSDAIVTGEALGQVSSQTLSNLNSIDAAADLPVLRPLIGFEKRDIVAVARTVGTAALSEKVPEHCALNRKRPATRSTIGRLDREEAKLDAALLEAAISESRLIDLDALDLGDLPHRYVLIDTVPDGAALIDLQTDGQFERWHPPGARRVNPGRLLAEIGGYDKERPVVLYCLHGTQSAVLAEHLQESGFAAYSFRGGTAALRKHLEDRDA